MNLQRVVAMDGSFFFKINLLRLFWRFECAQISLLAVYSDIGRKARSIFGHAKNSSLATFACLLLILQILTFCRITKIGPLVIAANAINMVNFVKWPFAGHIKPGETMSAIKHLVNFYSYITIINTARSHSNFGIRAASDKAIKVPGFGVIAKNLFKSLRCQCKIAIAHAVRSYKAMVWEVRPRVLKHRGLAYFSAIRC